MSKSTHLKNKFAHWLMSEYNLLFYILWSVFNNPDVKKMLSIEKIVYQKRELKISSSQTKKSSNDNESNSYSPTPQPESSRNSINKSPEHHNITEESPLKEMPNPRTCDLDKKRTKSPVDNNTENSKINKENASDFENTNSVRNRSVLLYGLGENASDDLIEMLLETAQTYHDRKWPIEIDQINGLAVVTLQNHSGLF